MSAYALRLLLGKNFKLSYRETGALFVTLLTPFLVMLLLYFDQLNINSGSTFSPELLDNANPASRTLTSIPPCVPEQYTTCNTIAYTPSNNDTVRGWVEQVARESSIPLEQVAAFETEELLNQHFLATPNMTQGAYIFDRYSLDQLDQGNIAFIIQYNISFQKDFPLGNSYYDKEVIYPAMAHQMQTVLMRDLSGKSVDIDLSLSIFPHPTIVEDELAGNVDAFSANGVFLTFASYFITLIFFLYRIVVEKERGLRDAMKLAGQTQAQHFISWTLPFIAVNSLVTFLLIGFGALFRFNLFLRIAFPVYFITMYLFSLSMISLTLLLSCFLSKATSVSSVGFNFLIFGYILATSTAIVYLEDYNGPMSLRTLFAISPVTTFYRALQYLAIISNISNPPISMSTVGEKPEFLSILSCWYWMIGTGIAFFILALYFDNVIATPHGSALSPLYFLQPSYWFSSSGAYQEALSKSKGTEELNGEDSTFGKGMKPAMEDVGFGSNAEETAATIYNPDIEDEDVRIEREAIARGERDEAALVIKNLSKKFKKFQAVDDLSLSIPRNSAFALLGHNGAGKSVTMKMLTTTLTPTSGDAYLYGLSIRSQKQSVRKLLGVCPQFDTFWDKLSGAEHIRLFAALRGYSPAEAEKEVELRLHDVDLLEKKDSFAGEYSGGMQRRLSVAISLTGDPRVVFLDECTSGSDSLVRRDLWATIQRAKEGRVIFLITHSIAEAQYIAGHNRIGIMAKGRLRVMGNALHLKTKFGAGHSLVVVLESQDNVAALLHAMQAVCAGALLKASSGSNSATGSNMAGGSTETVASFSLPRGVSESAIVRILELLEGDAHVYGIRNYSMDSTTLDEVFKSITSLSEDVREKGDD